MRHYEIVFLVHPDQSGQVGQMVERYQNMIKANGGTIDRFEDWGRRQLAYPINKIYKAHYILMNVTMDQQTHDELENTFRYNDAILRHLILKRDVAITVPSPIIQHQGQKGGHSEDSGTFGRGKDIIHADESLDVAAEWSEDQQ